MLNYFKKRRQCNMGLVFLASLLMPLSLVAEDLREAIQYGLVTRPSEMFVFGHYGAARHEKLDNIFNGLKLNRQESLHTNTNTTSTAVTNTLALKVVDRYLAVFYREKGLELAKANLRIHRMVFLKAPEDKALAVSLSNAEAAVLESQKSLQASQRRYAKVVGKWPSQLTEPQAPDNLAMPNSVGQAIEQGLDNYLFLMSSKYDLLASSQKQQKELVKRRSIPELSKSIRSDWEKWTAIGLRSNAAKKALTEASMKQDAELEAYNLGKISALTLLASQEKLYQAQKDANNSESAELKARYHILDNIGALAAFINTNSASASKEEASKPADRVLADSDRITYPYPDYKLKFHGSLVKGFAISKQLPDISEALSPCYVLAGLFQNKANAVALVNRLKALGFMAFLKTETKGSSVIIGPYDFPRHAKIGMKRLQDMAHVQGALVANA